MVSSLFPKSFPETEIDQMLANAKQEDENKDNMQNFGCVGVIATLLFVMLGKKLNEGASEESASLHSRVNPAYLLAGASAILVVVLFISSFGQSSYTKKLEDIKTDPQIDPANRVKTILKLKDEYSNNDMYTYCILPILNGSARLSVKEIQALDLKFFIERLSFRPHLYGDIIQNFVNDAMNSSLLKEFNPTLRQQIIDTFLSKVEILSLKVYTSFEEVRLLAGKSNQLKELQVHTRPEETVTAVTALLHTWFMTEGRKAAVIVSQSQFKAYSQLSERFNVEKIPLGQGGGYFLINPAQHKPNGTAAV